MRHDWELNGNPSVHPQTLNPLCYTSQGQKHSFLICELYLKWGKALTLAWDGAVSSPSAFLWLVGEDEPASGALRRTIAVLPRSAGRIRPEFQEDSGPPPCLHSAGPQERSCLPMTGDPSQEAGSLRFGWH